MAFKGFKFADGFFDIQDSAPPVQPTLVPSSSSAVPNHAPLRTESQFMSSNAFPPPVTPRHPLPESAVRPTLPALHIPSHFTASLNQTPSSSLRTPDSGYYSAFTNSGPRQLGIVSELLWEHAIQNKIPPSAITSVKPSNIFPYRFDDGNLALLSLIPSLQLAEDVAERANRNCELCGQKIDNMRAHMGMHILRKLRNIEENLSKPVSGDLPCGFCGESGHAECAVWVKIKAKSTSIETHCRLAAPIKYAYAERGSSTTPCRNVPIVCSLCPSQLTAGKPSGRQPAQWRYNMNAHLAAAHPEYASPYNPDGVKRLPHEVWAGMEIKRDEEIALGISADKIPAPFARVAGPDEGADLQPQQLGVRYRAPVRPTQVAESSTQPKKRRKGNGGQVLPPL